MWRINRKSMFMIFHLQSTNFYMKFITYLHLFRGRNQSVQVNGIEKKHRRRILFMLSGNNRLIMSEICKEKNKKDEEKTWKYNQSAQQIKLVVEQVDVVSYLPNHKFLDTFERKGLIVYFEQTFTEKFRCSNLWLDRKTSLNCRKLLPSNWAVIFRLEKIQHNYLAADIDIIFVNGFCQ